MCPYALIFGMSIGSCIEENVCKTTEITVLVV